ncbi:MAG: cupin domain-containing protein [Anaerolineales bacterium]|nr:cupin domain-containing protein [Anaerolineales bacterium]
MGASDSLQTIEELSTELLVGRKIRELRNQRCLSLRALSERSGLNINTLSLIENGKSSPSVGTLQQLALALDVSITTFFEMEPIGKQVVFTPHDKRPQTAIGKTQLHNLGRDLNKNAVQPFIVELQPGAGSGEQRIVHTGHEFVYCLSGAIHYHIGKEEYYLQEGDSLVFEAHLPHCWINSSEHLAKIILVIYPADERDEPGGRHFSIAYLKKELTMKIALITDDGKTISQHFGRAPYYLVVTIEDGKVVDREMRDKMGHGHFHNMHGPEESHGHGQGQGHGMDATSHTKHVGMAETIADCQALLCGGMGMGAYESMRRLNIQPVVTDLQDIEAAIQAFIDGKLIDHTELLH